MARKTARPAANKLNETNTKTKKAQNQKNKPKLNKNKVENGFDGSSGNQSAHVTEVSRIAADWMTRNKNLTHTHTLTHSQEIVNSNG